MSFLVYIERIATRALSNISVSTIILESGSYLTNTSAVVNTSFNISNVF